MVADGSVRFESSQGSVHFGRKFLKIIKAPNSLMIPAQKLGWVGTQGSKGDFSLISRPISCWIFGSLPTGLLHMGSSE